MYTTHLAPNATMIGNVQRRELIEILQDVHGIFPVHFMLCIRILEPSNVVVTILDGDYEQRSDEEEELP